MRRIIPIAGAHARLPVSRPNLGPGGTTVHRDADFPAYYGGRTVWPVRADMSPLGDAPDSAAVEQAVQQADARLAVATQNAQDQNARFKKDMINAAAKVAAVQTGAQAGMMVTAYVLAAIPIVGWILDAVIAVVAVINSVMARKYGKEVKQIVADAKAQVMAYQQAAQARVHDAESQVAGQLWPDAQVLANSGQPLDGLGDFWSNLRDDAKKVVRKAVTAVVTVHTLPVKFLGTQVIKGVRSVAGAVHDTSLQKKLAGKEQAWADEIDRSTKQTAAAFTNLKTLRDDAIHAVNIATGYEQVVVARRKAAELVAAAKQQIDAFVQQSLVSMQTSEYRTELTRDLARAIRGDPTLTEEAAYYQSQEQALAVKNGLPASTVVPTVKSSAGGTLAATAALVGAFFMLRR